MRFQVQRHRQECLCCRLCTDMRFQAQGTGRSACVRHFLHETETKKVCDLLMQVGLRLSELTDTKSAGKLDSVARGLLSSLRSRDRAKPADRQQAAARVAIPCDEAPAQCARWCIHSDKHSR